MYSDEQGREDSRAIIETAALDALLEGKYKGALADCERGIAPQGPEGYIWRAELDLYLDRLQDAEAHLDTMPDVSGTVLAGRVAYVRGEIAYWRYDASADTWVARARELADQHGDILLAARVAHLESRRLLRRSKAIEALALLDPIAKTVDALGNKYLLGRCLMTRAHAELLLGKFQRSGLNFASAISLLGEHEGLRWEAECRILHAVLLTDIGRNQRALEECEVAERVVEPLGIVSAVLCARGNMARVLLAERQYDRVLERLSAITSMIREQHQVYIEVPALEMATIAAFLASRIDDVAQLAGELEVAGKKTGNGNSRTVGRIFGAWSAARLGAMSRDEAIDTISAAQSTREHSDTRAMAHALAADLAIGVRPDLVERHVGEAETLAGDDIVVRSLIVGSVIRRSQTAAIRISPKGEFVIDPSRGWPSWDEIFVAVRAFAVTAAVAQNGGRRADAARTLNMSRSRLHDLAKLVDGQPVRPRKGRSGEEAGEATAE